MIRVWLMFLLILPGVVTAQEEPDPAVQEFIELMFEPRRGYVMRGEILGHSFAAHLHAERSPLSLAALSDLGAAYDPQSDTPLTAGIAYFHLARPIALLREIGGDWNELFARSLEARIRWLDGDSDGARRQIEDLLAQARLLDAADEHLVSLLADAAILAYRDGEIETAQAYLLRARACGQPRCPSDFIFDWLAGSPEPNETAYAGYDPDRIRAQALAGLGSLTPDPARMQQDIELEWRFVTGRWARLIRQMLDSANDPDLAPADRHRIRLIADRMQGGHDMVGYLMSSDSVASEAAGLTGPDGTLDPAKLVEARLSYLPNGRYNFLLVPNLPVLFQLYGASDRPGDRIVARTLEARLLLSNDAPARALELLTDAVDDARIQGFSNAQLHAVLMDQWAAAVLADRPDVAAQAATASAACRAVECPDDLVKRLTGRIRHLPATPVPGNYNSIARATADAFLRRAFPGDMRKLADLYDTGAAGGRSHPIDAARQDRIALGFAEKARDMPLPDLVKRAAGTMDTLIYAGQYRDAAAIGDRIEARVLRTGSADDLSAAFYIKRARASARLGEVRAEGFYAAAVQRLGPGDDTDLAHDLALDLLDTGYDDLLLRLIGDAVSRADIRARALYRQGRYSLAASSYRGYRRNLESLLLQPREILAAMFAARAATHLRGGNADAAAAALLASADPVPHLPDHPLAYSSNIFLRALAIQEIYYLDAAGNGPEAERLRRLAHLPGEPRAWPDLSLPAAPELVAAFDRETRGFANSMSLIQPIIEFRDSGNYQGAAYWMRSQGWMAKPTEQSGKYIDAQTLWQMAFTFARGGDTAIAFDLMDRAARIASTLSFEGAGAGGLQLLERDRWRYLLFVDIAWAALSGKAPDDMLVVSRY